MDFNELIPVMKDLQKKMYFIQPQVDAYNGSALIGLEYTVEIYNINNRELSYRCVLCERVLQNVWDHWTSFTHRLRYLERHYPTVLRMYPIEKSYQSSAPFRRSKLVVHVMAEAIEAFHGRLKVNSMSQHEFHMNQNRHIEEIMDAFHFDEKFGPSFVNKVEEKLQQDALNRNRSMEIAMMPEECPIINQKFVVNNGQAVLRYKWEQYRSILKEKLKQMEAIQMNYEKSPESHPLYSDEWDIFWVKRFTQLKAENIDPKTYDYKPEWMVFWSERMKELFDAEVEQAKKQIKASLELPEDAIDYDYERSQMSIDHHHFVDLNCQPIHDPVNSHHSRTLSHSPSIHQYDNVQQHYHRRRSRSRSPLRASVGYREESPLHFHAVSHDDNNSLDHRRNIDNRSPLRYYDTVGEEALTGTRRFMATHGDRNSEEANSFSSTFNGISEQRRRFDRNSEEANSSSFNEISEQRRFVDHYRESSKTTAPYRRERKNDAVDKRKYEVEETHRRKTYDNDDDRPVPLRLEEDSSRRTKKIKHKDEDNGSAAKDKIRTLAVIDRGGNDWGLTTYHWRKVETLLTRALVEVLKQNHGPTAQFRDAGWYQGRVKLIAFKDERSPIIYKEALRSLGEVWPGARLDLIGVVHVPNRPRAFVQLPAKPSRPNEILELLQKSNPDLPTSNWKISKLSFERGGFREATITINGKTVQRLEAANGCIRYGEDTIKLRLYHEDGRDMKKMLTK